MIKQRIVSNFGTISVYKFNVVLSIFRILNPQPVVACGFGGVDFLGWLLRFAIEVPFFLPFGHPSQIYCFLVFKSKHMIQETY
jgi:hypothetical protein